MNRAAVNAGVWVLPGVLEVCTLVSCFPQN